MPATATSTTDIGKELVALCREGKNMDVIAKFYSPNIVSIEPVSTPEMPAETKGIDAIRKKNQWWAENNEVHGAKVTGPYVGADQFVVHNEYDTTFKPTGQRVKMEELALYTVKDGKIVREQFFYNMPGA